MANKLRRKRFPIRDSIYKKLLYRAHYETWLTREETGNLSVSKAYTNKHFQNVALALLWWRSGYNTQHSAAQECLQTKYSVKHQHQKSTKKRTYNGYHNHAFNNVFLGVI